MKKWVILFFSGLLFAAPSEEFKVRESQSAIELMTPYGTKAIIGDYLPEGNDSYRIEIPLSELKPLVPPADAKPEDNQAKKEKKKKDKDGKEEEDTDDKDSWKPTAKKDTEKDKKNEPSQIVVQYDETDRLVLEANRLYNRGQFYQSTAIVEELLRRKPTYIRGWIMKGSLMYVQKQKDLARKAWEQALAIEPTNLEVKNILEKFK